ncbi:MAG: helix-turn-helix transcriptional regulator [Sphingopyxis sp.]|nr:helix-turn-helix transcriptional regulator [Sphingopyxis sp.]
MVLDILLKGERLSGAEIARATRLKSGTLYPLLLRLERAGWLTSEWEREEPAVLGRPRRRFYAVTAVGIANARDAGTQNAKIFGRLAWS